jgi:hypothetical protein
MSARTNASSSRRGFKKKAGYVRQRTYVLENFAYLSMRVQVQRLHSRPRIARSMHLLGTG